MKTIPELIKIAQFILIIVLVVIGGLHAVKVMLSLADAYQAIDDPCNACEVRTIKVCTPDQSKNNIFCAGGECTEMNITLEELLDNT